MTDVLIVDDEASLRTIISAILKKAGIQSECAGSAEDALEKIKDNPFKLLITDFNMPGKNGLELIEEAKKIQPWLGVIMITAFGTMDTAIHAMRLGVNDFITKPFDNNELLERVEGLLKVETNQEVENKSGIIGNSEKVLAMVEIATKAANSDANVLLLGESGTGKEVLARYIHNTSERKDKAFVAVNCGAIPESLMESEIFGYKKGAFSGAICDRPGKVEMAEGGTLFLDEIGEMPLLMQVKLLRVLQEKQVERLGSNGPIDVNFRLVAATHRNLNHRVEEGSFREDLFFRLNVIPIELPSLKDRGDDVIELAEYFINKWNVKANSQFQLSAQHKELLKAYHWPGNIRELENTIERAVVLGEKNELFLDDKKFQTHQNIEVPNGEFSESKEKLVGAIIINNLKETNAQGERENILKALELNKWNKTKTAAYLEISRRSLLYKVKAYDIG